MKIRTIASAVLFACSLIPALPAASAPAAAAAEPPIVTTALRGGVYLLTGRGGNIALLASDDGALLIDDQYQERTALIRAAVAEVTPQPIRWVINTHWHMDHTGGNAYLGAQGVTIIAQENARRHLVAGARIDVFKMEQPPTPSVGLPVVTFAQGITMHRGGETLEVDYPGAPAHTDGDAVIFFRAANIVHTGDVFVRYGWPFLDTPNGGSLDGTIRACEFILERINDDTLVIPGHGALAKKSDVAAYAANLRTARDRLVALVDAGKTDTQIADADPLRGIDFKEATITRPIFTLLALESIRRERKR